MDTRVFLAAHRVPVARKKDLDRIVPYDARVQDRALAIPLANQALEPPQHGALVGARVMVVSDSDAEVSPQQRGKSRQVRRVDALCCHLRQRPRVSVMGMPLPSRGMV